MCRVCVSTARLPRGGSVCRSLDRAYATCGSATSGPSDLTLLAHAHRPLVLDLSRGSGSREQPRPGRSGAFGRVRGPPCVGDGALAPGGGGGCRRAMPTARPPGLECGRRRRSRTGRCGCPPNPSRVTPFRITDPYAVAGSHRKAQLHCHTTRSDGQWAPRALLERYRAKGYAAVVFTDHNRVTECADLNDGTFLALPGVETTIPRPFRPLGPHMGRLGAPGALGARGAQACIDATVRAGGVVSLHHPSWTGNLWTGGWSVAEMMRLRGYHLIEISNHHSRTVEDVRRWTAVLRHRGPARTGGRRGRGRPAPSSGSRYGLGDGQVRVARAGRVPRRAPRSRAVRVDGAGGGVRGAGRRRDVRHRRAADPLPRRRGRHALRGGGPGRGVRAGRGTRGLSGSSVPARRRPRRGPSRSGWLRYPSGSGARPPRFVRAGRGGLGRPEACGW